jgi:serine/threonine-protein kinase RsbT
MTAAESGSLMLAAEHDVVQARQWVRKLAQQHGLRLIDQTKLVTAVSELARNTLIHGRGGAMDWALIESGGRSGIRLVFHDRGPGIADHKQALTDGWSSGSGLGLGLSGARRLVDEFELDSTPGVGTRVTIIRWI